MSNDRSYKQDRPIWLTSLADADRDVAPGAPIEGRIKHSLRRRRYAILAKRIGLVGVAAALGLLLWLPPKHQSASGVEPVDESVADAITEAMNQGMDDEADFVPTRLAAEQPLESVRVVRVSLPSGSLANYGVSSADSSGSEETTADLLVGQDGIARAIRIVK